MRVYYKYLPVFCIEERLVWFYNESICEKQKGGSYGIRLYISLYLF